MITRCVMCSSARLQLALDKLFMARNWNVCGVVIQFLLEVNMLLTSSRKLDETPPHIPALLTGARGTGCFSVQISTVIFIHHPWRAHTGWILANKGQIEEDGGKASGRCLNVSSPLQTIENECPWSSRHPHPHLSKVLRCVWSTGLPEQRKPTCWRNKPFRMQMKC